MERYQGTSGAAWAAADGSDGQRAAMRTPGGGKGLIELAQAAR